MYSYSKLIMICPLLHDQVSAKPSVGLEGDAGGIITAFKDELRDHFI